MATTLPDKQVEHWRLLYEEAEAIIRWATSPSAIEKLASRVGDVGS